jgi:hypothetical protein
MPKHHHTWFPKEGTCFVVRNVAPNGKRIRVLGCPIPNGEEKDLLAIPEISEAVIRHSLLKGDLRIKGISGEIIITCSDIDLLQFNAEQKTFLQSLGIGEGLDVGFAQTNFAFKQGIGLIGTKNGVNKVFTTPDLFLNGNIENNTFRITIRHNGVIQEQGIDFVVSEGAGPGTGFNTITFITFSPTTDSTLLANYVTSL